MTITTGEQYVRQLGIYNPDEHAYDAVTFIGVGGIGSFAAYGAAKLGIPHITLIDPDEVEPHNQPNQLYDLSDVGELKVEALCKRIVDGGYQGDVIACPWELPDSASSLSGVVVSGLDSMRARNDIWEHHIKLNPAITLYLDARLSGEFIVMYVVNPTSLEDIEGYERMALYSDDEAEDLMCTERGIIDVGFQVGSMVTRALRQYFTNKGEHNAITMMNQNTYTTTLGGWLPS